MATHSSSHGHSESHEHHSHYGVYVKVLSALLVLTVITVGVSRIEFGNWNIVVAMLVASVKAGIVAWYFMHLKYENPLIYMYITIPLLLLALLLGGVFIDQPLRIPAKAVAATDTPPQAPAAAHSH